MTIRSCVLAGAAATFLLVSFSPAPAAGQAGSWAAPQTANGHPDLQGVWSNNSVTPLERPEMLGDRETLTAEEMAALQARASELFSSESGDAAFGDSVFATVLAEAETF